MSTAASSDQHSDGDLSVLQGPGVHEWNASVRATADLLRSIRAQSSRGRAEEMEDPDREDEDDGAPDRGMAVNNLPVTMVPDVAQHMRTLRSYWSSIREAKSAVLRAAQNPKAPKFNGLTIPRAAHIDPRTMGDIVQGVSWMTQQGAALPNGGRAVLPAALREQLRMPHSPISFSAFYERRSQVAKSMPFLPAMALSVREELLTYPTHAVARLRMELKRQEAQERRDINERRRRERREAAEAAAMEQEQEAEEEPEEEAVPEEGEEEEEASAFSPMPESVPAEEVDIDALLRSEIQNGESAAAAPSATVSALSVPPSTPDVVVAPSLPPSARRVGPLPRLLRDYSDLAVEGMRLASRLHDVELAEAMLRLQSECTQITMAQGSYRHVMASLHEAATEAHHAAGSPLESYWMQWGLFSEGFFDDSFSAQSGSMIHPPEWEGRADTFLRQQEERWKFQRDDADRRRGAAVLASLAWQRKNHAGIAMDYTRLLLFHATDPRTSIVPSSASTVPQGLLEESPAPVCDAEGVPVTLRYSATALFDCWDAARTLHLPLFIRHYGSFANLASSTQAFLLDHMLAQGTFRGSHSHHMPRAIDAEVVRRGHPPVLTPGEARLEEHEQAQMDLLAFFPSKARHTPEQIEAYRREPCQVIVDRLTDMLVQMQQRMQETLQLQQGEDISLEEGQPEAAQEATPASTARAAHSTSAGIPLPWASPPQPVATPVALSPRPPPSSSLGPIPFVDTMARFERDRARAMELYSFSPQASAEKGRGKVGPKTRSRVMLRFLRPLFLACVRSGRTSGALQTVQLQLRCSLIPSFKAMSACIFLLSEEQKRLQLNFLARRLPPGEYAVHQFVDPTQVRQRNEGSLYTHGNAKHMADLGRLPSIMEAPPSWDSLRSTSQWAQTIQRDWPLTYDTLLYLLKAHTDCVTAAGYMARILETEQQQQQQQQHLSTDGTSSSSSSSSSTALAPSDWQTAPLSIPFTLSELESLQSAHLRHWFSLLRMLHLSPSYFRLDARTLEHPVLRPFEVRMVRDEMKRKRQEVQLVVDEALAQKGPLKKAQRDQVIARAKESHPHMDQSSVRKDAEGNPVVLTYADLPRITPEELRAAPIPLLQQWLNSSLAPDSPIHPNRPWGFHLSGWKSSVFRIVTHHLTPLLCSVQSGPVLFGLLQEVMALHLDVPDQAFQHAMHRLMHAEQERFAKFEAKQEAKKRRVAMSAAAGAGAAGGRQHALAIASENEPYVSRHAPKVAWLLLVMFDLGMRPPVGALEWVHAYLSSSATLADLFYMQALRQRMESMFLHPSRGVYRSWIAAEVGKSRLAETLIHKPHLVLKPPTAFASQAAALAAANQELEEASIAIREEQADESHRQGGGGEYVLTRRASSRPSLGFPAEIDGVEQFPGVSTRSHGMLRPVGDAFVVQDPNSLDAAIESHREQWEWVLQQSGLIPAHDPSSSATSGVTSPLSAPLSGVSIASLRSRGGLFRFWLGSALAYDPEQLLGVLDLMKREGVTPDLECFSRAMEACVQMCAEASSNAAGGRARAASMATLASLRALATSGVVPGSNRAARAQHYALLLLSDMRSLGVQPDIGFINNLAYVLLCNGAQQLLQELLATTFNPHATIHATLMGGGVRRMHPVQPAVADADAGAGATQLPLRVGYPLSLEDELSVLEAALASMQEKPPAYEAGLVDTLEEFEDSAAAAAASASLSPSSPAPLYVRADAVTLSVLEGGLHSMDYPPNLMRFLELLRRRVALEQQLAQREAEWNEQLRAQAAAASQPFKQRSWKRQMYVQPVPTHAQVPPAGGPTLPSPNARHAPRPPRASSGERERDRERRPSSRKPDERQRKQRRRQQAAEWVDAAV